MFTFDINLINDGSDEGKAEFIRLACDGKVILFIGGLTGKSDYDDESSSACDLETIVQGILAFALVLYRDHDSYHKGAVGNPGSDIVKDENNYYLSYPFFSPTSCGFGCCGGSDIGIHFHGDKVKITTYESYEKTFIDYGKGGAEYTIDVEEYVAMNIRFLAEMLKLSKNNRDYHASFWFLSFLLSRAALEGRDEVRKPLVRKLKQFEKENGVRIWTDRMSYPKYW